MAGQTSSAPEILLTKRLKLGLGTSESRPPKTSLGLYTSQGSTTEFCGSLPSISPFLGVCAKLALRKQVLPSQPPFRAKACPNQKYGNVVIAVLPSITFLHYRQESRHPPETFAMMLRPTFFAANFTVGSIIIFIVLVALTTRGVPDFRIPGRDQSRGAASSLYLDDILNSTLGVR